MTLTRKAIEKKYSVRLERDSFDLCGSDRSWTAYKNIDGNEEQIAWQYTLSELVEELETALD